MQVPIIKSKSVDPQLLAMAESIVEKVKTGNVSGLLVGMVMRDGNCQSTAYGDTGQLIVTLFDAAGMLMADRQKQLKMSTLVGSEITRQ